MTQPNSESARTAWPSFSIVLETENLSVAELDVLRLCLDSLAKQDLSPAIANEVLLIESGDAPAEMLQHLQASYPWLSVMRAPPDTDYYDAKMNGVRQTTGDIVVFCDSDPVYAPNWLRSLLTPFGRDAEIQAVAGETTVAVTGPYSLAMLLIWTFPPYTRRTELYSTAHYYANNVAFRRDFLLRNPIPTHLPIFRGNCAVHATHIRRRGATIWRQPLARAVHPLPQGAGQFFWRLFLNGHDAPMRNRLLSDVPLNQRGLAAFGRDLAAGLHATVEFLSRPLRRLPAALRDDPRRLLYLPLAVPVILAADGAFLAGGASAFIRSESARSYGAHRLEMAGGGG
jgi:glycosyltransferase involved in cell wall biosynthesis